MKLMNIKIIYSDTTNEQILHQEAITYDIYRCLPLFFAIPALNKLPIHMRYLSQKFYLVRSLDFKDRFHQIPQQVLLQLDH